MIPLVHPYVGCQCLWCQAAGRPSTESGLSWVTACAGRLGTPRGPEGGRGDTGPRLMQWASGWQCGQLCPLLPQPRRREWALGAWPSPRPPSKRADLWPSPRTARADCSLGLATWPRMDKDQVPKWKRNSPAAVPPDARAAPEQLRGLPSVQRPQQDPAPLQGKDAPRTGDRAAANPPCSEPAGGTSCSLTPDLSLHPSSITTGVEVPGRLSKRTFLTPTAVTQVSTLNRGNY